MQIENMSLKDVAAVHQLGKDQAAFEVSEGDTFWSREQLEQWVKGGEDVLLVAKEGSTIVGFALSALHKHTGKATWENLYVLPSHRNKGVGAALCERMVTELKAKGALYVCFFVRAENHEEIAYFGRRGFQQ